MHRRTLLATPLLAAPALAQPARARTLRFMPQAALAALDPIFNPTTIVSTHGFCVFDTLYGVDRALRPRAQMAAGHEVSADGLTWTITLREGLFFHDGEPVRAADCVASIRRWAVRDSFGQVLMRATAELAAPDDRRLVFRLHRPFPALPDALGKVAASPCFIMPARIAATPADRAIGEVIGSGPWRFLPGEFRAGAFAAYARNERYVPREEPAEVTSGGKRVHFDRLEITWIPDGGTAAAALRTGEIDWIEYPLPDLVPVLDRDRNTRTQIYDPTGFLGFLRFNHLHPPFDDVRVRRAIRDVLVQSDYMSAVALPGDWQECHALFPCGLPGTQEFAPAPRGEAAMARARDALRAAGYSGEPIIHINPTDFPAVTQQGRVTVDLMRRLGVNIVAVPHRAAGTCTTRTSPRPASRTPRSAPSSACTARAPGSAGRAMKAWRPRCRTGSRRRTPRPRHARWRCCRTAPGRRCPLRPPACSACAPPSAATWRACCRRRARCCGTSGGRGKRGRGLTLPAQAARQARQRPTTMPSASRSGPGGAPAARQSARFTMR
ncbi:MAG: ABC transporter substrate-binding protein [Rubritepida sp.]|nr:ABC transporter substrate-binding protein [Rubritepida sp.]